MSLRRQEGEFDILYVGTSEPSAPEDPTDAAYTKVGLLGDLSDEQSNDTASTLDRASTQHESVIYGQQSSSVTLTCNVQKDDSQGTTTEDAGQIILRDAAINQDIVYWLIIPEDDQGNKITDLEGEHGSSVVESIENSRNAGEFKQFDVSLTNREQPTYFTVT